MNLTDTLLLWVLVPLLTGGVMSARAADVGGDGLGDFWQLLYRAGDLTAEGDADHDGATNQEESRAGTDPFDAGSVFAVSALKAEVGRAALSWQGAEGRKYQLQQRATDLPGAEWEPSGEAVAGLPGEMVIGVDPAQLASREFRIVAVQGNGRPEPAADSLLVTQDSDGDGQGDYVEFVAGTDPHDANSKLLLQVGLGRAVVEAQVRTMRGLRYQLEQLAHGAWVAVGPPFSGTGDVVAKCFSLPGAERVIVRCQVLEGDADSDGASDWEEAVAGSDPNRVSSVDDQLGDAAWLAALPTLAEVELARGSGVADVVMGEPATLRLRRTGNPAAIIVGLEFSGDAVAGLDFEPLPSSVKLPAGVYELDLPVVPLESSAADPARRLVVNLSTQQDYVIGGSDQVEVPIIRDDPARALSVTDFGATGDGVSDDRPAIQLALNALAAAPGTYGRLHFPAGRYRLAGSVRDSATWTSFFRLLRLKGSGLDGRDLVISGDPGAVLFSNQGAQRAHLLEVEARFRSLRFEGLAFEKDSTPLEAVVGAPSGADAIALVMYDGRAVDSVIVRDCRFLNCHGALFAYGRGYDNRGKLARLEIERCEVLNPYGANTVNSLSAFGGGQQFNLTPWVGRAIYRDNLLDGGGEDMTDASTAPGGRLKDGGHFGSPMELIFEDNVVLRMGVEALHQINDITYMTASATPFTMPPVDGTTVAVGIFPADSTFTVGDAIIIRTPLIPGQSASNNLMVVESVDGPEQLTLSNTGHPFNVAPGTAIPNERSIYRDTEREPGIATIRRNLFDGTEPPGSTPFLTKSGIVTTAKVDISANLVLDYSRGIVLFDDIHTPTHSANWGSIVRDNVIQTRDAALVGNSTFGIEAWGDESRYEGNFIQAPFPRRVIGIVMNGRRSVAVGNHVHSAKIERFAYNTVWRSNGIGAGNTAQRPEMIGNYTRGLDIGVGGASPSQYIPHLVRDHHSLDDVLPVDPLGLFTEWGDE